MDIKEKNISSEEKEKLQSTVELFSSIFADLSNDAKFSADLLSMNIKSTFAQEIDEAIKNPLQTSFKSLEMLENAISDMLKTIVKSFLAEKKQLINSVYLAKSTENLLHYSIVLNDYNLSNKSVFNNFIANYEKTVYSKRFPIVFQIIPESITDAFEKEITNGNFEIVNL